jgi:CPA2 family monovalent cation:H+ antiporter-2
VGYLLAGVLIGPHTPGFVADAALATQLAEIGVMLLMFGVGLHFSIDDLLAVRRIAIPGALVQMAVATGLGVLLAQAWGWPIAGALVFGLSLSVASTVVLLRALEARDALSSHNGRIAVGWLVVEDLAMVLVLVLLPALAGSGGFDAGTWAALAKTLLAAAAFVALMLLGGRRVLPWLLWLITKTGSRELFTLCVMAVAVSIAYGASLLFGVSVALGPSSPGWCCASRSSATARPSSRCRFAMRSRCCSSCRWACCSTPTCWSNGRCRCWRWPRSSSSASRWRPPRWCWRCATR